MHFGSVMALRSLIPTLEAGESCASTLPAELAKLAGAFPLAPAIDTAARVYRHFWGPCPSEKEWATIADEVGAARHLFSAQGWLPNPSKFFIEPPPLRRVDTTEERAAGRTFAHLQFDSEYEPLVDEPGRERWLGYRANRTVHAWCLRHRDRRPRPWIVCIHGYGMGFPFVDFRAFPLAELHERLGCNVLMPVLPLHGPRRIRYTSGERFLDGNVLDTVHAEAQTVWDLRRILGWIRHQGATRIGVLGLSLGGFNAALLASVEKDLGCVIAGIPAVHLLQLGMLHTHPTTLERASTCGVIWSQVEELLRVVSPLALSPQVQRDRLFLFAGTRDRLVPPAHVLDLWQHWRRPRIEWYGGGHFTFSWERGVRRLLTDAIERTLLDSRERDAA
jgi:pimeloyl-ACP methyl ester carboxylesterase